MITLSELKQGEQAKITGFAAGNSASKQHLLTMGLTPGTTFILQRIAPLGDPVEISLRGYRLSLRKSDADILRLVKVST